MHYIQASYSNAAPLRYRTLQNRLGHRREDLAAEILASSGASPFVVKTVRAIHADDAEFRRLKRSLTQLVEDRFAGSFQLARYRQIKTGRELLLDASYYATHLS